MIAPYQLVLIAGLLVIYVPRVATYAVRNLGDMSVSRWHANVLTGLSIGEKQRIKSMSPVAFKILTDIFKKLL